MRAFELSADISLKAEIEETATSISWVCAALKSEPGGSSQAKIGIRTPCLLSDIASSRSATPNQPAPHFCATKPISINPCP